MENKRNEHTHDHERWAGNYGQKSSTGKVAAKTEENNDHSPEDQNLGDGKPQIKPPKSGSLDEDQSQGIHISGNEDKVHTEHADQSRFSPFK